MYLRRRKLTRDKVTLIVLVSLLSVAALLVVYVNRRKPVRIMPPEVRQETAVAAQPSSGTSYVDIEEFRFTQPVWPEQVKIGIPRWMDRSSRYGSSFDESRNVVVPRKYWPVQDSIGSLLRLSVPDDSPEMAEYLEKLTPIVEDVHRLISGKTSLDMAGRKRNTLWQLESSETFLKAKTLYASRVLGDEEQAWKYFLDRIHLSLLFAPYEMVDDYESRCSGIIGSYDSELLRCTRSPEELREVIGRLEWLKTLNVAPIQVVENELRALDSEKAKPIVEVAKEEDGDNWPDKLTGWIQQYKTEKAYGKARRQLRDGAMDLIKSVELPPEEFAKWENVNRDLLHAAHFMGAAGSVRKLRRSHEGVDIAISRVQVMLALEVFKRARGDYPDELSALNGGYLSDAPSSRDYLKRCTYRRHEDDYELLYKSSPEDAYGSGRRLPFPQDDDIDPACYVTEWKRLGPVPQSLMHEVFQLFKYSTQSQGDGGEEEIAVELQENVTPPLNMKSEWKSVEGDHETGVVRFGNVFDMPRGEAYYFLAYLHAYQDVKVQFSIEHTNYWNVSCWAFAEGGITGVPTWDGWATKRGTTPLLLRMMNWNGADAFRIAISDEDGKPVSGVEVNLEP